MTDRNFIEVIDRVIECIPSQDSLKDKVRDVRRNARFRAPEMQRINWEELVGVLTRNLPDPSREDAPDWCKKIGRIMRAEE